MNLLQALLALGTTPEQVADTLRQKGIHGYRRRPGYCPVANYLRTCGLQDPSVGVFDASVQGEEVRDVEHLPQGISFFIKRFDRGEYPDLLEKDYLP